MFIQRALALGFVLAGTMAASAAPSWYRLNCVTTDKDVLNFIMIDSADGTRAIKGTLDIVGGQFPSEQALEVQQGGTDVGTSAKLAAREYTQIKGQKIVFMHNELLKAAEITLKSNIDLSKATIPSVKASVVVFDYDGTCIAPSARRKVSAVCTVEGE